MIKIYFMIGLCFTWTFISPPNLSSEDLSSNYNDVYQMSLSDAVFLAIRHNRSIKSAYLTRVTQKFDLRIAEYTFLPDIGLTGEADYQESTNNSQTETQITGRTGVSISEKIPTGAQFTFGWDLTQTDSDMDQNDIDANHDWNISVNQPLLNGFGIHMNMATVEIARINEEKNILSLNNVLINTITQSITAYREFLRVTKQVRISEDALKRSETLLKTNELLIKSGRLAANELVQSKSDLANQKLSYQKVLNNQDDARLSLLKLLDIDQHLQINPIEEIIIHDIHADFEKYLQIALKHNPDYLTSKLNLEVARINLLVAKSNRLWDLALTGSYSDSDSTSDDESSADQEWSIGIQLKIPFYGTSSLSRKQQYINAKKDFIQAGIDLKEAKNNLEIDLRNALRNVKMTLIQVKLAEEARNLTKEKWLYNKIYG